VHNKIIKSKSWYLFGGFIRCL